MSNDGNSVMLMIRVPVDSDDPMGFASLSDGEISSRYFSELPLQVERTGGIISRGGGKREVHLSAVIERDFDSVVRGLRDALARHSFPERTRVIKMWRGDDFVLRNNLVFEHPEPTEGEQDAAEQPATPP